MHLHAFKWALLHVIVVGFVRATEWACNSFICLHFSLSITWYSVIFTGLMAGAMHPTAYRQWTGWPNHSNEIHWEKHYIYLTIFLWNVPSILIFHCSAPLRIIYIYACRPFFAMKKKAEYCRLTSFVVRKSYNTNAALLLKIPFSGDRIWFAYSLSLSLTVRVVCLAVSARANPQTDELSLIGCM